MLLEVETTAALQIGVAAPSHLPARCGKGARLDAAFPINCGKTPLVRVSRRRVAAFTSSCVRKTPYRLGVRNRLKGFPQSTGRKPVAGWKGLRSGPEAETRSRVAQRPQSGRGIALSAYAAGKKTASPRPPRAQGTERLDGKQQSGPPEAAAHPPPWQAGTCKLGWSDGAHRGALDLHHSPALNLVVFSRAVVDGGSTYEINGCPHAAAELGADVPGTGNCANVHHLWVRPIPPDPFGKPTCSRWKDRY